VTSPENRNNRYSVEFGGWSKWNLAQIEESSIRLAGLLLILRKIASTRQPPPDSMRTVLICQHDASLVREIMPRWLHSFSEVVGIVVIRDVNSHRMKKLKRSLRNDGIWGTLDLLAYRLFHKFRYAAADRKFEDGIRQSLGELYPAVHQEIPVLETTTPNGPDVQAFLQSCRPDVMLACCKHILKPSIFEQAQRGTFVMHPGICPEYRNAHGCFWALVQGDMERVGMTLLKIDRGIDTGPVYGYFSAPFDEQTESHLTIQRRMTYGNLAGVRRVLEQVEADVAETIPTIGRSSAVWGQPTLTSYLRWKRAAGLRGAPATAHLAHISKAEEPVVPVKNAPVSPPIESVTR
jgi:Formyl transferase